MASSLQTFTPPTGQVDSPSSPRRTTSPKWRKNGSGSPSPSSPLLSSSTSTSTTTTASSKTTSNATPRSQEVMPPPRTPGGGTKKSVNHTGGTLISRRRRNRSRSHSVHSNGSSSSSSSSISSISNNNNNNNSNNNNNIDNNNNGQVTVAEGEKGAVICEKSKAKTVRSTARERRHKVKFRLGAQTLHQRSKSDSVANIAAMYAARRREEAGIDGAYRPIMHDSSMRISRNNQLDMFSPDAVIHTQREAQSQQLLHQQQQQQTNPTTVLKNWASSFFRRPLLSPTSPSMRKKSKQQHQQHYQPQLMNIDTNQNQQSDMLKGIISPVGGDTSPYRFNNSSFASDLDYSLSPPDPLEDLCDDAQVTPTSQVQIRSMAHLAENVQTDPNPKDNASPSNDHKEGIKKDTIESQNNSKLALHGKDVLPVAFEIRKIDDREIARSPDHQENTGGLSLLLKPVTSQRPSSLIPSDQTGIRPVSPKSRAIVKVFIPPTLFRRTSSRLESNSNGMHKISVLLSDKATVNDLIIMALRQFQKQTGGNFSINPAYYVIRAAENDGSIDHDMPTLNKSTRIIDVGCECFVMLSNNQGLPNQFNDRMQATIDKILKKPEKNNMNDAYIGTNGNTSGCDSDNEDNSKSGNDSGGVQRNERLRFKRPKRTVQSRYWNLEDVHLTVYPPDSVHPTIVPIAPDVMLKHAGTILTDRFGLDRNKHSIKFMIDGGQTVFLPELIRNEMIHSLKATSVVIQAKNPTTRSRSIDNISGNRGGSRTMGSNRRSRDYGIPTYIISNGDFSEEGASSVDDILVGLIPLTEPTYREYRAIKTNKYGMRQERILGIDSKTLYNKMPRGASSIFGITYKHKTSYPERPISTITQIHTDTSKPLSFDITFDDGETLFWEAKTQVELEEILSTLKHLVRLHQQQKRIHSQSGKRRWSLNQTIQMSP